MPAVQIALNQSTPSNGWNPGTKGPFPRPEASATLPAVPPTRSLITTKARSSARRRCFRLVSTVVLCAASAMALTSSAFDDLVGGSSFAAVAFDGTWNLDATPRPIVVDARPAIAHAPFATAVTPLQPPFLFDQSARAIHAEPAVCDGQPVDRRGLRAPPADDDDSSDADGDDDDDDDDDDVLRIDGAGSASASAAPANVDLVTATGDDERPIDTLPTLDVSLPISFVFDVQSLRAPPR